MATATVTTPPYHQTNMLAILRLMIQRDPLRWFAWLAHSYGDVVRIKYRQFDAFLLSHPDAIREVLVVQPDHFSKGRGLERTKPLLGEGLLTSEGELHKRQRRLIQPAFHRNRIAGYTSAMVAATERMCDTWIDGATVDMAQEMMRLTLTIVGQTLFGADVEGESTTVRQALTTVMENFRAAGPLMLASATRPPIDAASAKARDQLDAIIYRMIAERRASGKDHGDLLSMLLLAQDAEGDGTGMSDQQVRDEAMTLFLAGHETTANALAWTWYLLDRNPEAEAKLHQEMAAVLGGRAPTMDDVPQLVYTTQVISESMRLYPPAWVLGRRCHETTQIGGLTIPAGTAVIMSQWIVHHDPRWYRDPERFDPERWTAAAKAARPKFAYFPFGGGPRLCIGESFAWAEMTLVLATLVQRWKARLVPGHPIGLLPLITLRPKYGMRMTLHQH